MSSHPCCFAPDHIADVARWFQFAKRGSQMSDDHFMCELNDKLSTRTPPIAEKASEEEEEEEDDGEGERG